MDMLPNTILLNECAIVNLDNSNGFGTHWVAYAKIKYEIYYFDSFGCLPPTKTLIKYFNGSDKSVKIYYNQNRHQDYGDVTCGKFCLRFLLNFQKYYS